MPFARLRPIILACSLALASTALHAQSGTSYYRYVDDGDPTTNPPGIGVTCGQIGNPADPSSFVTDRQQIEWNNATGSAQIRLVTVINGVRSVRGTYPMPTPAVGSNIYSSIYGDARVTGAYPFTYAFVYETLEGGRVVHRSTLSFTCAGDGRATNNVLTNEVVAEQPPSAISAVPTLSEWATLAVAGLLGLFGMGAARRARR